MNRIVFAAAAVFAFLALIAKAGDEGKEIVIGITLSTTGPAAALGIPERNALDFVPKEIGGVKLKVIALDDGGDPTNVTARLANLGKKNREHDSPSVSGLGWDHERCHLRIARIWISAGLCG